MSVRIERPFKAMESGPAPGWIVVLRGEDLVQGFGYGGKGDAERCAKHLNRAYALGWTEATEGSLFKDAEVPA